jgi:hypothetical protein
LLRIGGSPILIAHGEGAGAEDRLGVFIAMPFGGEISIMILVLRSRATNAQVIGRPPCHSFCEAGMKLYPKTIKKAFVITAALFTMVIMIGVAFLFMRIITQRDTTAAIDFSVYWVSARLLSHGQSPYDSNAWAAIYREIPYVGRQDNTFLYPLPTAIIFLPFSIWSESLARDLWIVLSQLMIVFVVVMGVYAEKWKHRRLPLIPIILLCLIIFIPDVYAVMHGQITSLLVAIVAFTIYLWSRKMWLAGGMVLGFLILKPTSTGTFALAAIVWLILLRKWRGLIGTALTLTVLFTIAWIVDPRWFGAWLTIVIAKPAQMWRVVPTLWGLCVPLFGTKWPWLIFAALIGGMLVLFTVYRVSRKPLESQIPLLGGILIPISLMATPYLLRYEMMMLIPSIIAAMALLDRSGGSFAATVSLPLILSLLSVGVHELSIKYGETVWILLPILVMGSFLLVSRYAAGKGVAEGDISYLNLPKLS